MDPKTKKGLRLAAAAIFVFALAFNIKITLDDPFLMLSDKTVASTTSNSSSSSSASPGNWKATYPECEFPVSIGIPPLVITKTEKGTYRVCSKGSGVCLFNDGTCCKRAFGICVL